MNWLLVAAGLVILTGGAELLIRGSVALARKFNLSELLIGLTLVGFGTSTPEMVSSIQAAMIGSPGVAIGNVVGSNIANILLILGVSAAITPIAIEPKSFRRDATALSLATLLAVGVSFSGEFSRIAGAGFLVAIATYIAVAYLDERKAQASPETQRHKDAAAALPEGPRSPYIDILLCAAGLGLLIVGARFLITGSIAIARELGVSETIIGLTIVAVGTSLPELVTSTLSVMRGKGALALGNVVGSNIYNILGILGATALVKPVAVPSEILRFDNWVLLAATAAMVVFSQTHKEISRLEGVTLLAGYIAYIGWLGVHAAA